MHKIINPKLESKLLALEQKIEKQAELFYHKRIIKYMSIILTMLLIVITTLFVSNKVSFENYKKISNRQILELQESLTYLNIAANKDSERLRFISFADSIITSYRSSDFSTPERVLAINAIWTNANEFNLSPYLLLSVQEEESGFRKIAKSPKGARGIYQFMPATFLACNKYLNYDVSLENIHDIETQTRFAAFYIRFLYDITGDMHKALTMYNMGSCNTVNDYAYKIMHKSKNYERKNK